MARKSLYVEPTTGGYELIDNKLTQTHPSVVKCNNILLQRVGAYIYNLESGNPLVDYTGEITQSFIINSINICLTPLVNNNDILDFTILNIESSTTIKNRFTISIQVTLPNGDTPILNYKQA